MTNISGHIAHNFFFYVQSCLAPIIPTKIPREPRLSSFDVFSSFQVLVIKVILCYTFACWYLSYTQNAWITYLALYKLHFVAY